MVEGTGPNPKPATSWQWDLRHTTDSASQLESATESSHFELLGGMRHDACGAPSIRQRGRSSLLLPPASLTFGTSRFPHQGCTSLVPIQVSAHVSLATTGRETPRPHTHPLPWTLLRVGYLQQASAAAGASHWKFLPKSNRPRASTRWQATWPSCPYKGPRALLSHTVMVHMRCSAGKQPGCPCHSRRDQAQPTTGRQPSMCWAGRGSPLTALDQGTAGQTWPPWGWWWGRHTLICFLRAIYIGSVNRQCCDLSCLLSLQEKLVCHVPTLCSLV